MANLLEIKDAQRQIGDSFALCNVNLAVTPGEIGRFRRRKRRGQNHNHSSRVGAHET